MSRVSEGKVVARISPRVSVDLTITDVARAFIQGTAEEQAKILLLVAQQLRVESKNDEIGELSSHIKRGGLTHTWLLKLVVLIETQNFEPNPNTVE